MWKKGLFFEFSTSGPVSQSGNVLVLAIVVYSTESVVDVTHRDPETPKAKEQDVLNKK